VFHLKILFLLYLLSLKLLLSGNTLALIIPERSGGKLRRKHLINLLERSTFEFWNKEILSHLVRKLWRVWDAKGPTNEHSD
jgi:hypothetical protein